ncbi:MAG: acyl-[Eubacterium sp.]|nr:acyl-[acyl-carrier-protein] thioesterase [Eubacterium sp.]
MYSYTTRVRYSEITLSRVASLLSIINYFQDCCTFEAEDRGVGIDWLNDHKTAWMLTSWQIKIDRRPKYCENIKVTTWACGFRFFVGKRNFTIENAETGELLVYAYSEWAYVNIEKGLPEKNVPEEEFEAYGIAEPLNKEFEKGRIKLPDDVSLIECEPITVTDQYIDTNHHVNNGQYIAIAMTALSEEFRKNADKLKSFRAEYKLQSVKGDVLYPCLAAEQKDKPIVILKDLDDKVRLTVEFTM